MDRGFVQSTVLMMSRSPSSVPRPAFCRRRRLVPPVAVEAPQENQRSLRKLPDRSRDCIRRGRVIAVSTLAKENRFGTGVLCDLTTKLFLQQSCFVSRQELHSLTPGWSIPVTSPRSNLRTSLRKRAVGLPRRRPCGPATAMHAALPLNTEKTEKERERHGWQIDNDNHENAFLQSHGIG